MARQQSRPINQNLSRVERGIFFKSITDDSNVPSELRSTDLKSLISLALLITSDRIVPPLNQKERT